ncbi:glycosyltransferase family 4 protein [soil metagenome]
MKVALVYDRVNKWGGAERVLLALHELFPDAPLYTSVYNKNKTKWAKVFDIYTSFLQEFPFAKDAHELYPLLMPTAFESFNFDDYDLVISVTSEAAKGVLTKPHTLHICYCLTPTRYLWSGYDEYFHSKLSKLLSSPAIAYLRSWDKVASTRPDRYIAISQEVKKRIETYYENPTQIIHPPVGLFEGIPLKSSNREREYFLVVSRLVPYKRIDLAIEACNNLKLRLKVVGAGSELDRLKSISGPTIEFLGAISDEELIPIYEGAKALIFPGFEDFGIVMVEALGFGTPVIAFKRGGALDIVEHKKTGIFFSKQKVSSLMNALALFEKHQFDPRQLRSQAKLFSKTLFKKKMSKYIVECLQMSKI